MAGTATNFAPTLIRAGSRGHLWANVATPAAGARITLHTDGTPESVANPNAVHLGMTREGATFRVVPSFESYAADEFASPVKTLMSGLEGTLEAELLQVADPDLLAIVTAGFGTAGSGSGYEEVAFGIGTQVYTSIALIFPTEADPTKFAVCHLYKAFNESGLDAIGVSRRTMSGLSVRFRGVDITSRAATDTLGKYWLQVA